MEKLIVIHPLESKHKAMFERLNSVLFFEYEIWKTYRDQYHFDFDYYIQHLQWSNLYTDVPETIELWKVTGRELGINENVPYPTFLEALQKNGFSVPPRGTGLWLPEAFKEQDITFEGSLCVFAPIEPLSGKSYKTFQLVLSRNANFHEGKIYGECINLRPTETVVSPDRVRIVEKISI